MGGFRRTVKYYVGNMEKGQQNIAFALLAPNPYWSENARSIALETY
jgi:hypothetical protein